MLHTIQETARREAHAKQKMLDEIAEMKAALLAFEWEVKTRGGDAFESNEYRDLLDAFYDICEIDAVWDAAREIGPRAGYEDPYAQTPAEIRAGRYADVLVDERIGK